MASYTFYIRDDRYGAPTMAFVIVEDEGRARELAARHLHESTHYTAIDVYEGEDLKFSVRLGAQTPPALWAGGAA